MSLRRAVLFYLRGGDSFARLKASTVTTGTGRIGTDFFGRGLLGTLRARLDDSRCDHSVCVCVPVMTLGLLCTTLGGLVGGLRGAGVEGGCRGSLYPSSSCSISSWLPINSEEDTS
jgi:hypothetical protein